VIRAALSMGGGLTGAWCVMRCWCGGGGNGGERGGGGLGAATSGSAGRCVRQRELVLAA
jgi:hypothetical protein